MKIQMTFDFTKNDVQQRDVMERYFREAASAMMPTFEFKAEFEVDDEVTIAAVGKNCSGTILGAETIRALAGMVGEKKSTRKDRGIGEK